MKKYLGIYNTNQINKYGYKFTVEALEASLSQSWKNGTPMFISHDYHRPFGWSKPFGLMIHSGQVSLYGISCSPEDNSDHDFIDEATKNYLFDKLSEVSEEEKLELKKKLEGYLSGNEIFIARECTCVIDENIARKVLPNIFSGDEADKRSLVSIKNLEQIAPGVFLIDGYAVFAHRYYRRSLSQINNLNDSFLSRLYELKNIEHLDIKIALDPHSLGLASTYRTPIELEYWWGPKFNDSLLSIPPGVTCHKSTEELYFFHRILRTEFWWHKQNGIQSLECEEIRDIPTLGIGSEQYGCRYIHSMINSDTALPYHLDGAVRIYNDEKFIARLDTDISKAGKDTDYIKLWRIDGDIDVSTWKNLICHFYRDNHLPGEYLSGEDEQRESTKANKDIQTTVNPLVSYISPYLKADDGLQIFMSYHTINYFENKSDIEIITYDSIAIDGDRLKVIEMSAVDFIKLIRRKLDIKVDVSGEIQYIVYEDLDINLPLVLLKGNQAVNNANKVLDCFKDFCTSFANKKDDRIITASIGVEYDESIVIFSFALHVASIKFSYPEGFSYFPETFSELGDWCSQQHELLMKRFNGSCPNNEINSLLKISGQFRINRVFVPDNFFVKDDDLEIKLRIHKDEFDLIKAVNEGRIKPVPARLVRTCNCTSCGNNYFTCNCSCFMDANCTVNITDFDLFAFTWANRWA